MRLPADEAVLLEESEPKIKKKSHKANKGDKHKSDKKSFLLKADSKVPEATGTTLPGTEDILGPGNAPVPPKEELPKTVSASALGHVTS